MAERNAQTATKPLALQIARTLGAVSLGGALMSAPLSAAEVIGESVVDGKEVALFSDGTWAFKPADPENCRFVSLKVYFCPTDTAWKLQGGKAGDGVVAGFRHDDFHYAQYVVTKVGTSSGRTTKMASFAALAYFEHAVGHKPIVISKTKTQVSGLPAETTVFAFTSEDIPYVFFNTIVLTDKLTVQIENYQICTPGQITDTDRKLHEDVVAATRIEAE